MTDPLPKYWKRGDKRYKLVTLASLIPGFKPLYILEDLCTGMIDAIPFDDDKLEVDE